MAAACSAGGSRTPRLGVPRRSARRTQTSADRGPTTSKRSSTSAAPRLRVKPRRSKRWPPVRRACRPRHWRKWRFVSGHATASGADHATAPRPTSWDSSSTGPWRRRSRPARPWWYSRVVASSPRMHSRTTSDHPRRGSRPIKARGLPSAAVDSSKPRSFWPPRGI
jgi:hypothetical protein